MERFNTNPEIGNEKLLIIELSKGNKAVFKNLYGTYRDSIYAYNLSLLKSKPYAEKIVKDVFLTVWKQREELDTSGSFRSYLFTLARNKAFNFLKKAATDTKICEKVFYRSQKSYSPKAGNNWDNDIEKIKQRLTALLSPRRKKIFEMSRNEGKSYADISEELGISVNTVKSQMDMALKTIRSFLLSNGGL